MNYSYDNKTLADYYSGKTIQSETAFGRRYARRNQARGINKHVVNAKMIGNEIDIKRHRVEAHAISKNFDGKFASHQSLE